MALSRPLDLSNPFPPLLLSSSSTPLSPTPPSPTPLSPTPPSPTPLSPTPLSPTPLSPNPRSPTPRSPTQPLSCCCCAHHPRCCPAPTAPLLHCPAATLPVSLKLTTHPYCQAQRVAARSSTASGCALKHSRAAADVASCIPPCATSVPCVTCTHANLLLAINASPLPLLPPGFHLLLHTFPLPPFRSFSARWLESASANSNLLLSSLPFSFHPPHILSARSIPTPLFPTQQHLSHSASLGARMGMGAGIGMGMGTGMSGGASVIELPAGMTLVEVVLAGLLSAVPIYSAVPFCPCLISSLLVSRPSPARPSPARASPAHQVLDKEVGYCQVCVL
ncbi:unnamed protein product [Closterium sp. Naga37s-1]|nr:unnamed protein product [Closterium sp. Naga37s-1]